MFGRKSSKTPVEVPPIDIGRGSRNPVRGPSTTTNVAFNRREIPSTSSAVAAFTGTPSSRANAYPTSNQHRETGPGERGPGGHWVACEAGPGVHQHNGIIIEGDAELSNRLSEQAPQGFYRYDECVKRGLGDQINGFDVVYSGKAGVAAVPLLNGEWNNVVMMPHAVVDLKMQGRQINGGRLRREDHQEQQSGAMTKRSR
ncbi:hypothetical protein G7046_g3600 [Stylonectria norvegica]|nr:hypothetical protein G7046_g3600 [Stylonectria norvegica]